MAESCSSDETQTKMATTIEIECENEKFIVASDRISYVRFDSHDNDLPEILTPEMGNDVSDSGDQGSKPNQESTTKSTTELTTQSVNSVVKPEEGVTNDERIQRNEESNNNKKIDSMNESTTNGESNVDLVVDQVNSVIDTLDSTKSNQDSSTVTKELFKMCDKVNGTKLTTDSEQLGMEQSTVDEITPKISNDQQPDQNQDNKRELNLDLEKVDCEAKNVNGKIDEAIVINAVVKTEEPSIPSSPTKSVTFQELVKVVNVVPLPPGSVGNAPELKGLTEEVSVVGPTTEVDQQTITTHSDLEPKPPKPKSLSKRWIALRKFFASLKRSKKKRSKSESDKPDVIPESMDEGKNSEDELDTESKPQESISVPDSGSSPYSVVVERERVKTQLSEPLHETVNEDDGPTEEEEEGQECRPKPAPRLTMIMPGNDQMRDELFMKVRAKRASLDVLEAELATDKIDENLSMSMPAILPPPEGDKSLEAKSSQDMVSAINNAFDRIRNDVETSDEKTNDN